MEKATSSNTRSCESESVLSNKEIGAFHMCVEGGGEFTTGGNKMKEIMGT